MNKRCFSVWLNENLVAYAPVHLVEVPLKGKITVTNCKRAQQTKKTKKKRSAHVKKKILIKQTHS